MIIIIIIITIITIITIIIIIIIMIITLTNRILHAPSWFLAQIIFVIAFFQVDIQPHI